MLVKRASKVLGCRRIASASEAPASTSLRVARITAEKFLSSSWLPRMSRHCTSGRPASIITENWRVKTARFLEFTDLALAFFGGAAGLAATAPIRVTMICSRRSEAVTDSTVSPRRSPLMSSPPRVRPENAKVGMCVVSC